MNYLVDPGKATGKGNYNTSADLSKICGVHNSSCPYYITMC